MSSAEGLVGREVELALIAAAVRDLSEGRASALVIEGKPASARPAWWSASSMTRVLVESTCTVARHIPSSAPARSVWSLRL
jgi:hypothetical protein